MCDHCFFYTETHLKGYAGTSRSLLNNESTYIITRMLLTLVCTDTSYSGFLEAVDDRVSVWSQQERAGLLCEVEPWGNTLWHLWDHMLGNAEWLWFTRADCLQAMFSLSRLFINSLHFSWKGFIPTEIMHVVLQEWNAVVLPTVILCFLLQSMLSKS